MSPSVVKTGESKVKQAAAPNITVGEYVRAVFDGTWEDIKGRGNFPTTLTIGWDSREYVLEPGKDSIVPFSAVANAFGDPRSSGSMQSLKDEHGVVSWIIDRPSEVRRLRAKYDNQFGDETAVETYPNVKVYTLDGDELPTVLNDQAGDNVLAANVTVNEQDALKAAVDEQRKTIESLLQRLQVIEGEGVLATDTTPTVKESPPKSRSKPKQPDFQISTATGTTSTTGTITTTHEELPEDDN